MEQGNTAIYKHIKLLSHYNNISNNEFDIPSIIFERFAYLKPTPKAYMLKKCSRSVRHCPKRGMHFEIDFSACDLIAKT